MVDKYFSHWPILMVHSHGVALCDDVVLWVALSESIPVANNRHGAGRTVADCQISEPRCVAIPQIERLTRRVVDADGRSAVAVPISNYRNRPRRTVSHSQIGKPRRVAVAQIEGLAV